MAFDASRGSEPEGEPERAFQNEPIDYVDWAMRISVFAPFLVLYSYWIWTVLRTAFSVFFGGELVVVDG